MSNSYYSVHRNINTENEFRITGKLIYDAESKKIEVVRFLKYIDVSV